MWEADSAGDVASGVCIAGAGVDHDDIGTISESPALRSTDKFHESVWKRSLSSIIVAVSSGSGAPYSRTAEISCAMIDTVPEGRFQRVVAIFDHPSLRLNHEP
jgi:hypothetical protein